MLANLAARAAIGACLTLATLGIARNVAHPTPPDPTPATAEGLARTGDRLADIAADLAAACLSGDPLEAAEAVARYSTREEVTP